MPREFARHCCIALTCFAVWLAQTGPAWADASPASASAAPATQPAGVVNINTASAQELERLPRIGPTRSHAILALRTRLSRFTRLDELLRVKGIGRATFRKLRPLLVLQGPTTLPEKNAHAAR